MGPVIQQLRYGQEQVRMLCGDVISIKEKRPKATDGRNQKAEGISGPRMIPKTSRTF